MTDPNITAIEQATRDMRGGPWVAEKMMYVPPEVNADYERGFADGLKKATDDRPAAASLGGAVAGGF